IECNGGNTTEVQDRVTHYQTFCTMLGVDPGSNLSC
ncbi:MAG TPA: glycoside hydrolase family 19 protein, partial [Polyangia bacterium]|nr:glycoside hydrolase family 19 protein [Polyangia bacterium]